MKIFSVAAEWIGGPAGRLEKLFSRASEIIVGKTDVVRLAMAAVLSEGHLLIEDVPGVGKTTMVRVLAKLLGLKVQRIQFTNDMLPSDILGTNVFNAQDNCFSFHQGPVFTQLLIADELNRASPKTQSALLESMAERRVTLDGVGRDLPRPFVVVATQNPIEQMGTYPLPESQLDRFLMRLEMGFPTREAERELLVGVSRERLIADLEPMMSEKEVIALQQMVNQVHISEPVVQYVLDLISESRTRRERMRPLSPRSSLDLVRAARAWALIHGRQVVLPEDVKFVFASVTNHRLALNSEASVAASRELAHELMRDVRVP